MSEAGDDGRDVRDVHDVPGVRDVRARLDSGAAQVSERPAGQIRQASVYNIANALTIFRILLVPVFGVLLLHQGAGAAPAAHGSEYARYRILAAIVFALAIVTDGIDGDIARRRSLVTDFGVVSDPIADKALMGMALVGLSLLHELSWWVTVVILVREVGITVLRFFVIRHGVIPASRGGKAKTATQAVAVGLYVLPFSGWWHDAAMAVMAVAVALTVVTGADYVVRAVRLRRTSPRAQAKRTRAAAMDLQRRRLSRSDREPHLKPVETPDPRAVPDPRETFDPPETPDPRQTLNPRQIPDPRQTPDPMQARDER